MSYLYARSDFRLPPLQLNHIDLHLSFFESHVDGAGTLTLTAREPMRTLELDACDLEVIEVALPAADASRAVPLPFTPDPPRRKLLIELPVPVAPGEIVRVSVRCRCRPSDMRLEGIYRDTTPPFAPQQYVSQCQQWGFQRIFPVIDDCTAKCTFRTTLEGDVRYTHLISNGDVDRDAYPDGRPAPVPGNPARKVIAYVNRVPMAPYLFLACAGTWEVLADEVRYPDGRRIALEYLVPHGKRDSARIPMEILKRSILWQHAATGYVYPFDTYRTLCMEKSNYGGMENVGNTTIITEAALIDKDTVDTRLIYAHGVIVHEYEHNHCGSGVTMESPFDMWLNEAYTVDIERQFTASVFNPAFMRLREADAIREPGGGPLAMEDGGAFGQIVREGFNDPDELVDGVTYVKAPEVLNMLRQLLGTRVYDAATHLYFARHDGGNANTAQFLACFEEAAGESLEAFSREWLFSAGYPQVAVRYTYDDALRELHLHLAQTRTGRGGVFTLPFSFAAVDAKGNDLPGSAQTVRFDTSEVTIVLADIDEPAFLSLNRDAGFYGTCTDLSVSPQQLVRQVRCDSNLFNRVEAMRRLTDLERRRLLADPLATASEPWLDLYRHLLLNTLLPDGIRGYLLNIDEQPLDRALLPYVRESFTLRQRLLRAVLAGGGESAVFNALHTLESRPATLDLPAAIERRFLKNALLHLLSASGTVGAHLALEEMLAGAVNITDRLNTLTAIWQSRHGDRHAILAREGERLRQTPGGYLGYLQVVGQSPRPDVFDAVAAEECRPTFSLSHPGISRALYLPLTRNNAQLWTARGLEWLTQTVTAYAQVSEYNALRLIAPCQAWQSFAPDLRDAVGAALRDMRTALNPSKCPSVTGRLDAYLAMGEKE